MSVKKEYLILFAVIVVLIGYLAVQKTDQTNYTLPELSELKKSDITKIEIKNSEGNIELNKKDEDWFINEEAFKADNEKVKEMLAVLEGLSTTSLASESESYARYELDDDKKIAVKGYQQADVKRAFDIGKTTETYRHTFIKLADNKNVYHADGNFRRKFDLSVSQLRDKTVLSFETADIKSIRLEKGEKQVTIEKKLPEPEKAPEEDKKADETKDSNATADETKDSSTKAEPEAPKEEQWITSDNTTMEKSKVESFLTTLAKLKCADFMEAKEKENLKAPAIKITLNGTKEIFLTLYPSKDEEDSDQAALSSMTEYPFTLAKYEADRILKLPNDIFGEDKKKEEEKK